MNIDSLKSLLSTLLDPNQYRPIARVTRMLNDPKSPKMVELRQAILGAKPKLISPIYTWATRIYWILNDIDDFPKCKFCGESLENKNVDSLNGYERHCSRKCAYSDPNRVTQIKQTKIDRYGNENFNNIERIKQTCLDKYGSENFLSSDKGKQLRKNYCDKYGVSNPFQIPEVVKKISDKKGTKETNPEYWKSHNEAVRQTNLERYGVESYSQTSDFKEKCKATIIKNHGVSNGFLTEHAKEQHLRHFLDKLYKSILSDEYVDLVNSYDEFVAIQKNHDLLKFKCKSCGKEFEDIPCSNNTRNGYYGRCPVCFPQKRSINETMICQWIESLNFTNKIIQSDRQQIKPLELDIYIPEKKIAIEFDGLYWHKEDSTRMLMKTKQCESKGIHLIHIFESEWILKQDIVKSRLKNLFGLYDHKIGARQCEIRKVKSKISKEFQEQNHLQGSASSSVNLGLYHHNELVSLMTFSKPRFSSKYEYELVRFCNKPGYHIPGAASKLLSYFEKNYNPRSIVSYADRRWSSINDNVYQKLGFTLHNISNPNYWYWSGHGLNLESRIKFQKHKLKNLLENFDPNKSEVENMRDNGYNRIFDCGNLVYVWTNKKELA